MLVLLPQSGVGVDSTPGCIGVFAQWQTEHSPVFLRELLDAFIVHGKRRAAGSFRSDVISPQPRPGATAFPLSPQPQGRRKTKAPMLLPVLYAMR
jgi:hypothetical protein